MIPSPASRRRPAKFHQTLVRWNHFARQCAGLPDQRPATGRYRAPMALDEDSYEWASAVPRWQQQALARLAATQVLSQALRGPPRGVALAARGRECFEQAGSGLDAVASVDAA